MSGKTAKKEEFIFPSGGIADFYMEDHEIEALEREEALEAFGDKGIANFEDISKRMASYGRYGDDTVAHVETGELVIPKALIEDNPKLRDSIFGHLKEMGVEDPERYVVGSGANSINPDTGLPEFFLKKIKKAVSKITKGVSKSLKKIGKVFKKIAPIVLPIALAMTPLGPIYGAALGSGIGTLAQGGDLKDAFKSALISGGTGALFTGFTGSGTFSQNVGKALSSPGARLGQTLSGARSTFTGGGFTGEGNLFSDFVPSTTATEKLAEVTAGTEIPSADQFQGQYADAGTTVTDAAPNQLQMAPADDFVRDQGIQDALFKGADTAAGTTNVGAVDTSLQSLQTGSESLSDVMNQFPQGTGGGGDGFLKTAGDYMDTAGDYLFRGGQSASDIAANQSLAKTTAINDYLKPFGKTLETIGDAPLAVQNAAIAAGDAAAAAAGPGMLATYGPSAALTGAGLYAGGFFDAPPEDDPSEDMGPTGAELVAADPDKYTVGGGTPTLSYGPYSVATNYLYRPGRPFVPYNPFAGFIQQAAEGGEIFPRRVGGIMPDEGIPGRDSVRAMLMPGEFVMTTDAVKGLGNGNNQVGINRMYDMMRGLESKGKAMA